MREKRKPNGAKRPSAFDLFSGCGGLTVGLKRAGFSVLAAVECWDAAAEAYELNHKDVRLLKSDIRECDPVELMRSLGLCAGDLDLLAGCPPCQGFSSLRTLNGHVPVTDQQNDLIFEFVRCAIAILPKTILLENVPALESDERLVRVKTILKKAGYIFEARVLDAADYGVPQRRRRLLFLASRVGPVIFPTPAKKRVTVGDRGTAFTRRVRRCAPRFASPPLPPGLEADNPDPQGRREPGRSGCSGSTALPPALERVPRHLRPDAVGRRVSDDHHGVYQSV